MMQEMCSGDLLVPAEAKRLFERALELCDATTKLDRDADVAERLLVLVQRLADAGACAWYLEGGVLTRLREHDRWSKLRPDLTFAEFCGEVIGVRYRTAKYLMDIHTKATHLGLTPERLAAVGWTKAREFLPVATRENVETWIAEAEGSTRAALRDHVQSEKTKRRTKTTGGEPLVPVTVLVSPEVRDHVEFCLEEVAKAAPPRLLSRGEALDLICTESLANRLPLSRSLKWTLAQVQRAYKVTLAIVPPA